VAASALVRLERATLPAEPPLQFSAVHGNLEWSTHLWKSTEVWTEYPGRKLDLAPG
jgi:hypothetical protein